MPRIELDLPEGAFEALCEHLLPRDGVCEEAAFLFARPTRKADVITLSVVESMLIPPEGFASRSRFYLELTDESRAAIFKRAHDLGAALVECHSHPGQREACFSWSDLRGFDDFVPHARWRLAGRPYAAVVFAVDSVDAVGWADTTPETAPIAVILAGEQRVLPTGLTLGNWKSIYDRESL